MATLHDLLHSLFPSIPYFLSFQNQFFQFQRLDIFAIFVGAHVAAGNFVDQHDFIRFFITAEFEFNIVKFDAFFRQFFFYNAN